MKRRLRKKAYRCTCLFEGDNFLVTDDPYPIYNREFYCTIGKFNWTWGNHCDEELPCENCKAFKLSRRTVREKRENDKRAKKGEQFYNYIERNAKRLRISFDDYIDRYYDIINK